MSLFSSPNQEQLISIAKRCLFLSAFIYSGISYAHGPAEHHTKQLSENTSASATYLANEGLMISSGKTKILFDPFFHNDYGTYQLVPEPILQAMKNNQAPYNNINMVFISHAHGDHFAAQDMLEYMVKYEDVWLVAPQQAIDEMAKLTTYKTHAKAVEKRIKSIQLAYKDTPISFSIDNVKIDAVRIPHAGWPGRAEVSNIVFRVTLPADEKHGSTTYIHMGDADPNDSHFRPISAFWQQQKTDVAFPPYWFFLSSEGNYILDYRINAKKSVGVHVPIKIPAALISTGKDYFSTPGQSITVPYSDAKK